MKPDIFHYISGNYARRNKVLAGMIAEYFPVNIVEVAGAEGGLCKEILKQSHRLENYYFSDLDEDMVTFAKKFIGNDSRVHFSTFDADKNGFLKKQKYDCFVSTALEHLVKHEDVLKKLKSGTLVALSLPDFYYPGHHIWFPTAESIIDRYSHLLTIRRIETISGTTGYLWRFRDFLLRHKDTWLAKKLQYGLGLQIQGNWRRYNVIAFRK